RPIPRTITGRWDFAQSTQRTAKTAKEDPSRSSVLFARKPLALRGLWSREGREEDQPAGGSAAGAALARVRFAGAGVAEAAAAARALADFGLFSRIFFFACAL